MFSGHGFLLIAASTVVAGKDCYFPRGQPHENGIPCDPDAKGPVACCEKGHTCLSNGLCWDTQKNNILRESCTDASFPSPACNRKCDGDPQGHTLGYLRQCPKELDRWTCTPNKDPAGCQDSFGIDAGRVADYRNGNVSNVDFANGTIQRAGESGGSTANGDENDIQQAKMQVGLGAGLGVGLPLLIALAVSLWFLGRARREVKELKNRQSHELASWYGSEQASKGHAASSGGYATMAATPQSPGNFANLHSPDASWQNRTQPQEMDARPVLAEAESSVARTGSIAGTPSQYYSRPAPE